MVFNKNNKAQSLALNTIVIAMLVIIVLLVIIVFFTGSISKTGSTIDDNNPTSCSDNNPAIKALGYSNTIWSESKPTNGNYELISVISSVKGDLVNGIAVPNPESSNTYYCYGIKK